MTTIIIWKLVILFGAGPRPRPPDGTWYYAERGVCEAATAPFGNRAYCAPVRVYASPPSPPNEDPPR